MNWDHIHQSILKITLNDLTHLLTKIDYHYLMLACQSLYDSIDLLSLQALLFNSYYLSQTNHFTISQVQLAKSYLTQYITQNPNSTNLLYNIIESIVLLTEQQILLNQSFDPPKKKEFVYERLLKGKLDVTKKSVRLSKSTTPEKKIDYSYQKLIRKKEQADAFRTLSTSVDIEDANMLINNYKLTKSTDTSNIPLKQMAKSNLHNYYVTLILKPLLCNAYKLSIINLGKKEIFNDTFKEKTDCLKLVDQLRSDYKLTKESIFVGKDQTTVTISKQQIQAFQETPKLGQVSAKVKQISSKLKDSLVEPKKLLF